MRKYLSPVIALLVGLVVLAGYFFQSELGPVLSLVLNWGLILVAAAGLLGLGYLLWMHFRKLIYQEKGAFYSGIVLITFIFALVAGLVLTTENEFYRDLILNVQIPVEASLLGILAVTLLLASLRLIRTQGWTPLSIGFLSGAVVSLFLNLGFQQGVLSPFVSELILFIKRLPLVGARGILLGMALGGLVVGLRVLSSINRPYGEG